MRDDLTEEILLRGKTALRLGLLVLCLSTLAYYALGCVVGMNARHRKSVLSLADDRWELTECLYASAITVSTVGYTDLLGTERCVEWVDAADRRRWVSATDGHEDEGFDEATAAVATDWSVLTRAVTSAQVIVGMAFFLYVIAQVTSFFTEGGYGDLLWSRRTRRLLARSDDHVIICGAGGAARRALDRLRDAGMECVVLEVSHDEAQAFRRIEPRIPCLVGDATEEEVLRTAGVERARALLCMMPDDSLNLVTAVTARGIAPRVRIVSRALASFPASRLLAAGADTVVPLEGLAGLRAASETIRPSVVDFLDVLLRAGDRAEILFEGLRARIPDGAGVHLWQLGLRERAGILAIALRHKDDVHFVYNPTGDEVVREGDEVAVFGRAEDVDRARRAIADGPDPALLGKPVPAFRKPVELPERDPHIARREGHIVVCGGGLVGLAIARELHSSARRFVLIERDPERCETLARELPVGTVLEGDARETDVLHRAGLERARGLVTALPADRDNLVMVVAALQDRPGLRVVAVARDSRSVARLQRSGANVVDLDAIAGRRVAADVLRPEAATFLDRMRASPGSTRFDSAITTAASGAVGKTLIQLDVFAKTGMRILALRHPGEEGFTITPPGDAVLREGTVLIGVGAPRQSAALAALIGEPE